MEILFDTADDDVRIDGENSNEGGARLAKENVDRVQELQDALRIARIQT